MDDLQKLIITESDGSSMEVEIITSFYNEGETKQYLVYTRREKQSDNNIIYVSIVKTKGDNIYLEDIEDDEEWAVVKGIIKEILSK